MSSHVSFIRARFRHLVPLAFHLFSLHFASLICAFIFRRSALPLLHVEAVLFFFFNSNVWFEVIIVSCEELSLASELTFPSFRKRLFIAWCSFSLFFLTHCASRVLRCLGFWILPSAFCSLGGRSGVKRQLSQSAQHGNSFWRFWCYLQKNQGDKTSKRSEGLTRLKIFLSVIAFFVMILQQYICKDQAKSSDTSDLAEINDVFFHHSYGRRCCHPH